eukprot:1411425-Amphidinium_carterae.2
MEGKSPSNRRDKDKGGTGKGKEKLPRKVPEEKKTAGGGMEHFKEVLVDTSTTGSRELCAARGNSLARFGLKTKRSQSIGGQNLSQKMTFHFQVLDVICHIISTGDINYCGMAAHLHGENSWLQRGEKHVKSLASIWASIVLLATTVGTVAPIVGEKASGSSAQADSMSRPSEEMPIGRPPDDESYRKYGPIARRCYKTEKISWRCHPDFFPGCPGCEGIAGAPRSKECGQLQ